MTRASAALWVLVAAATPSLLGWGCGRSGTLGAELPPAKEDASPGGAGGVAGEPGGAGGAPWDVPEAGDSPYDCAGVLEESKLTPVNLIFMIDRSGSMGAEGFDPTERWIPVSEGLIAFFDDPGTTQLQASLEFFPAEGDITRACNVRAYSTPLVPLKSLDDEGTEPFSAAIAGTTPQGGTPTLPALEGAIDYALLVAADYPASKTVVVFVTDGEPGFASTGPDGEPVLIPGCDNNTIEATAAEARAAAQGDPQILTYVIGIGPSLDALDAIAEAGGTNQAIMVPVDDPTETREQFRSALSLIRENSLSCSLPIPDPPNNQTIDPNMVNVYYESSLHRRVIGKSNECENGTGWVYGEHEPTETPTMINICPGTCTLIQGDVTGRLHVMFGCVTIPE